MQHTANRSPATPQDVVYIVDDNRDIRDGLRALLERSGKTVFDFPSGEAFLEAKRSGVDACLLLDAYLPGASGLDVLERLRTRGDSLPVIVMTGRARITLAVESMRSGAVDFVEKPVSGARLLTHVDEALSVSRKRRTEATHHAEAVSYLSGLTDRQAEILRLVLAGEASKSIAATLGISQRTVENHRAAIMTKSGARSIPELTRIAVAARWVGLPVVV